MFQNLRKFGSKSVVVMHDFFIDRIVWIDDDLDSLFSEVNQKARVGGGSIRDVAQTEIKGGNAVNLAYALARLEIPTSLITLADPLGKSILQNAFSGMRNAKLLVGNGRPGYTVSLEVGKRKSNVMVSDVGGMSDFGPERLGKKELEEIKNASAVVITNWASNEKGTDLALKVFKSSNKKALCFLDPADMSNRKKEFRHCLEELDDCIDVLSVNENECRQTMKAYHLKPLPVNYSSLDIAKAAKILATNLGICVDVHTPIGSATSNSKETSFEKALKVDDVAISTGAGDVWDAGDVLAHLAGLQQNERLALANVLATYYISTAEHPTIQDARSFYEHSCSSPAKEE